RVGAQRVGGPPELGAGGDRIGSGHVGDGDVDVAELGGDPHPQGALDELQRDPAVLGVGGDDRGAELHAPELTVPTAHVDRPGDADQLEVAVVVAHGDGSVDVGDDGPTVVHV